MIGRNTRSLIIINRIIWKIKVCVFINSRKTFIIIYKLTHFTNYVLCMPYIQPNEGILGNSEASSFISAQNAQYLDK